MYIQKINNQLNSNQSKNWKQPSFGMTKRPFEIDISAVRDFFEKGATRPNFETSERPALVDLESKILPAISEGMQKYFGKIENLGGKNYTNELKLKISPYLSLNETNLFGAKLQIEFVQDGEIPNWRGNNGPKALDIPFVSEKRVKKVVSTLMDKGFEEISYLFGCNLGRHIDIQRLNIKELPKEAQIKAFDNYFEKITKMEPETLEPCSAFSVYLYAPENRVKIAEKIINFAKENPDYQEVVTRDLLHLSGESLDEMIQIRNIIKESRIKVNVDENHSRIRDAWQRTDMEPPNAYIAKKDDKKLAEYKRACFELDMAQGGRTT